MNGSQKPRAQGGLCPKISACFCVGIVEYGQHMALLMAKWENLVVVVEFTSRKPGGRPPGPESKEARRGVKSIHSVTVRDSEGRFEKADDTDLEYNELASKVGAATLLDHYGESGWELVTVRGIDRSMVYYYLKRNEQ